MSLPIPKINVLLVDDEPHWQSILSKFIQMSPLLHLVGIASTGMEAYAQLSEHEVDLLLCDIELPDMSGMTLMRNLRQPPLVVFVTAHRNYALDCYELSPVDFLLKPIDGSRFVGAVEKVRARLQNEAAPVGIDPYFFVRIGSYYEQIMYRDVQYIQAQENFLNIVTTSQTYTPLLPLTKLEEQLRGDSLLRVHRSYIVNRAAITRLGRNDVVLRSGEVIPVSDQYRAKLNRVHVGNNLFGRVIGS